MLPTRTIMLAGILLCMTAPGYGQNLSAGSPHAENAEAVRQLKNNDKLLVPGFYRARYRDDISPWFNNNHIFRSLFLLCTILFPLLSSIICGVDLRKGKYVFKEEIFIPLFFIFNLALVVLAYLISYFISIILSLIFDIFSPDGFLVPVDFVCFSLLLVILSIYSFWLAYELRLPRRGFHYETPYARATDSTLQSASTPRSRLRPALRAMLRTGMAAAASALGARIGGWLGGLIVFVLASGVAAAFGVRTDNPVEHK